MRTQTIPEQVVAEDIIFFEHQVGAWVRVLVGKGSDVNGAFVPFANQTYETIMIADNPGVVQSMTGLVIREDRLDYKELMSANPSWAPNKPAGTFRKEDLWHFIDLIRSRG